MKAKIAAILDDVPANDAAFAKVAEEMPEIITSNNKAATYLSSPATPEEIHLASMIRTTAQMYHAPDRDGARGNDGYDGEEDQNEEIALPATRGDSLIDPRITEAISHLAGSDTEAECNEMVGEGDIDDAQDSE